MSMAIFTEFGIVAIIFRLLISAFAGYLIGLNREHKRRSAGTRTHSLVCMASCLVMLTSEYVALKYPQFTGDINRLGAQVISGMGFIGAGSIIITRYNHVRGITTAASLWATACIGLAVGIGFVEAAVIAVLIMLFILIVAESSDRAMKKHSTVHDYLIIFNDMEGFSVFLSEIKSKGFKINNIEVNRDAAEDGPTVFITLEAKEDMTDFVADIQTRVKVKMFNEI